MSNNAFVHLHVHSHFSLLDGCIHQRDLVAKAKSLGMESLALTDHGSLFGALEFFTEAKAQALHPIIGMEAYVARGAHTDRETAEGKAKANHLTLLARNQTGYKNLIHLSSVAYTDGFYRRPRIDNELLESRGEGLVALSGCMGGAIPQAILAGDLKGAETLARRYHEIFGADHFYLELMRNGVSGQEKVNQSIIELAGKTGLPLVATNDVHYLNQEDSLVHEVVVCINTGQTLKSETRMKMETDQFYFRSGEEMSRLFEDLPEAIENTNRIAEICQLDLEFGKYFLPEFHPPSGEEPLDYLRKLCYEGATHHFKEVTPEVKERMETELDVIASMGFPSYFLIVWDFIRYARENHIPVGPGRGSAAGSLVAYCLGITEVNPLKYDLIFERFLNSSRISMPDIDIDFCRDGREKVIQYVQDKYGSECVCQIVTFGTMAARAAVRDAGRVLDVDLGSVDRIAKMIPMIPKTKLRDALDNDPELQEIYDSNDESKELFDISMKIEGLNRHASTHAAGVVITDKPLMEYVPLCRVQNEINTQYQMEVLEKIGLLKMDFLGLRNLTIMDKAVDLIEASEGIRIDLSKIPFDDPQTFELLQAGNTMGIFQLESEGMSALLVRLRPDCFEDIIALLALYRPGPLKSGMVDSYVKRKHNLEEVDYLDDSLEEVLKETYGVIVYQEQVMRIANILAGFSMNDADSLRKAMGKKRTEVMAKFKKQFVDGAVERGADREKARGIYENIEFFAGYGFNKSHSTAYGFITYQTAYLKAHYPRQFMAALMTCDASNSDKISEYRDECKRMNIELLGPDFNESHHDFALSGEAIRFGLSAIKGLGDRAIETIVNAREAEDKFATLPDMLTRVDLKMLNKTALEALVKAGAFDSTETSRATYMHALEGLTRWAAGVQSDRLIGQKGLFSGAEKNNEEMKLPEIAEWDDDLKLTMEKEALGFFLSSDPLQKYGHLMKFFAPITEQSFKNLDQGCKVTIAGMVQGLREVVSKNGRNAGKKMALFRIRTRGGTFSAVVFSREYEEFREFFDEDRFCVFRGSVDLGRDGNSPSLRVETVCSLDDALKERASAVIIRFDRPEKVEEGILEEIREAASTFPGPADLFFHFEGEGKQGTTVKAGSRFGVKMGEDLVLRIEEIVGKGNLELR